MNDQPSAAHLRPSAAASEAVSSSAPHRAKGSKVAKSSKGAQKGLQTRTTILNAALLLAQRLGLEGLTIGALADANQMSKSGVFAHFGSREELQISVIREYHQRFEDEVFRTGVRAAPGLPRFVALIEGWIGRIGVEVDSASCLYISGAVEFDDQPGPVRDALVTMVRTWHAALQRALGLAITHGHLQRETDVEQMLFEIHGTILAYHYEARLIRSRACHAKAMRSFERILERALTPEGAQCFQALRNAPAAPPSP